MQTDLEGVDDQTMKVIAKKYIGQKLPSSSTIRRWKKIGTHKCSSKSQLKLKIIPLLLCPLYQNKIFLLYGGIMMPSDFSNEEAEVIAERRSFEQSCQHIIAIEKRKIFTIINYSPPFVGLKNFQFLIDIYNRKGKQSYKNLAMTLESFQNNIQTWTNILKDKLKKKNHNIDLYNKRVQEFHKATLEKIEELDPSKFYIFGIASFNYEKQELEQTSIGFSQAFLSLLGTDPEQFTQINLRSGNPWNQSGDFIIESLISSLSLFSCNKLQNQRTEIDTSIVTFDGLLVPCKEIRQYYIPQDLLDLGYIEMGYGIVEFDVSLNILKQLFTLRANRLNNPKIYNQFDFFEEDNFEYSMNSQTFLEKYYPEALTVEYLCCKYRLINQNPPSLSHTQFERYFEKTDTTVSSVMQQEVLSSIVESQIDNLCNNNQFLSINSFS